MVLMARARRKLVWIVALVALWLALGCTAIPINIPAHDGSGGGDLAQLCRVAGTVGGAPGYDGPIPVPDGWAADASPPPPGDAAGDGAVLDGFLPDGLPDGLPDALPDAGEDGGPDSGADADIGLADTTAGEV